MSTKAIAARLGLAEEASEKDILAALNARLGDPPPSPPKPNEPDPASPTPPIDEPSNPDAPVPAPRPQQPEQPQPQALAEVTQAVAAELHQAACAAAVERFMAQGKIPPAQRDKAIAACGTTAKSLKAACALFDDYPEVVQRVALPKLSTKVKLTTLDAQQKKLAAKAGISEEQWLATMNEVQNRAQPQD